MMLVTSLSRLASRDNPSFRWDAPYVRFLEVLSRNTSITPGVARLILESIIPKHRLDETLRGVKDATSVQQACELVWSGINGKSPESLDRIFVGVTPSEGAKLRAQFTLLVKGFMESLLIELQAAELPAADRRSKLQRAMLSE